MPPKHRTWKLPEADASRGQSWLKHEIAQIKKSTAKQMGLLAALVTLVVLVGCLWSVAWEPEVDQSVARMEESHTCPHCGHLFQITVAEAARMRRAHSAIQCPACRELGAEKNDARPFTGAMPPEQTEDSPPDGSGRAQRVTGGMRKADR